MNDAAVEIKEVADVVEKKLQLCREFFRLSTTPLKSLNAFTLMQQ
jgi:hypothetical protein